MRRRQSKRSRSDSCFCWHLPCGWSRIDFVGLVADVALVFVLLVGVDMLVAVVLVTDARLETWWADTLDVLDVVTLVADVVLVFVMFLGAVVLIGVVLATVVVLVPMATDTLDVPDFVVLAAGVGKGGKICLKLWRASLVALVRVGGGQDLSTLCRLGSPGRVNRCPGRVADSVARSPTNC